MENSNEEIRCGGDKDGVRSRGKRFDVRDERAEEVMDVDDALEGQAKSLDIHFANDCVSA